MANTRLIARLDIKAPYLIKSIQLEGLKKIGLPEDFARRYYQQGIDEILYMDAVASLYERNSLIDLIRETTNYLFIPITVGGGLRTLEDVRAVLRAGADKVAINTAALKKPELIAQIADVFGSQCVVLSIEAKSKPDGSWEAYYDGGREHSHCDVIEWAVRGAELGAGEILLTSVDQEGTGQGFDIELVRQVATAVSVPVVASGGMGSLIHLKEVMQVGKANAVAMAYMLHYNKVDVPTIRAYAKQNEIRVRQVAYANNAG